MLLVVQGIPVKDPGHRDVQGLLTPTVKDVTPLPGTSLRGRTLVLPRHTWVSTPVPELVPGTGVETPLVR